MCLFRRMSDTSEIRDENGVPANSHDGMLNEGKDQTEFSRQYKGILKTFKLTNIENLNDAF